MTNYTIWHTGSVGLHGKHADCTKKLSGDINLPGGMILVSFSSWKQYSGQSASIGDNYQTLLSLQQLLIDISANDNRTTGRYRQVDTGSTARAADCCKHGDCMRHWTLDGNKALINGRHPAVLSKLLQQSLRMTVTSMKNSGLLFWVQQHPEKSRQGG